MHLRALISLLMPGSAEREPGFLRDVQSSSCAGLTVLGAVTVVVTGLIILIGVLVQDNPAVLRLQLIEAGVLVTFGFLGFFARRLGCRAAYARPVALLLAFVLAATLNITACLESELKPMIQGYIPAQTAMVLLVTVAALPLLPLQSLSLGTAMILAYCIESVSLKALWGIGTGPSKDNLVMLVGIVILATAISAVLYRQRWLGYQAQARSLRAAEEMRQAEGRMLAMEHAASIGRLAAALSHEVNSPVGALRSAVDTLLLASGRQLSADETEQQRLVRLQADLRKSIRSSTSRLNDIVLRLQRFANLDQAEVQVVNVNDLIADAAALVRARVEEKGVIETSLGDTPNIRCRPAQLSVVLHAVLSNATDALSSTGGRIRVSSSAENGQIEITVADNGAGMAEREAAAVFQPKFSELNGRIASGNWTMFNCRRLIREHGGEIELQTAPERGTVVKIMLPVVN